MVNIREVTIAATILCACNAFAKSLLSTSSSDEDIDTDAKRNNNIAVILFKDRKPQSGQHKTWESYNGKAHMRAGKSELKNTDHKKLEPGLLNLDDNAEIKLDGDADIGIDVETDSSDSDDDSNGLSIEVLRSRRKTNKKICKKACKFATINVCERCDCSRSRKKSMAKKCLKKCKRDLD